MSNSDQSNSHSYLNSITFVVFAAVMIILVIALAYSLGVSYSERQLRADHNTEQYSGSSDERIARACVGKIGPAHVKCVQEKVTSSEDHRRSEYDLSAQEDMSEWAFWLLWVSIGGIAVSTLALYFMWDTLTVTRETLISTQVMSLDAHQIGAAQTRAYISMSEGWLREDKGNVDNVIEFSVYNSGVTPALDVVVSIDTFLEGEKVDQKVVQEIKFYQIEHKFGLLDPSVRQRGGINICPGVIDKWISATSSDERPKIRLNFKITYRTVFGEKVTRYGGYPLRDIFPTNVDGNVMRYTLQILGGTASETMEPSGE
ncbi:hypothetical protein GGR95_002977 [Sulfitobacter undariae]|uniref:Uncharacterized protein n=1 Tax=Sulfitobacter undariae TaxID=1563671 RepID=A0A7W6E9X5_9RHOB|nr:hypothetical protein [Sulfitobacter undariae]MBB3995322.1 hypothetical protein [Sulfitobacter undariae]